jgi:AbrB family looped-hinge helix DNA binding protein
LEKSLEKKSSGTLRDRGQITIPKEIREEAQLEEGAEVDFEVREPGEVVIRRKISFDTLELDDEFVQSVISTTTQGYATLRADDAAWASELEERAVLEGSLDDGLSED